MFKSGNQEWKKRQLMSEAMRIELVQYEDLEKQIKMGEAPRKVAKKAIEAALAGEPWAIAFVFDRMDGKPQQNVSQSIDMRVETVSEAEARAEAEAFIEAQRIRSQSVGQDAPDPVCAENEAGLQTGQAALPDSRGS